jgi:predicted nucleotidyltransferase
MTSRNEIPVTLPQLQSKRTQLLRIAQAHGATNVRVFGSVSRGEAQPQSDVDFVVDLPDDACGFEAFGILDDLRQAFENIVGRPVDVVTLRGPFSPRGADLAETIRREARAL